MTRNKYKTIIIGSGPAGLSAAARVAEHDKKQGVESPSYILLEAFSSPAKTIYQYQKGKFVMDEPSFLNLRSPIEFTAGKREDILNKWDEGINNNNVNIKYDTEVVNISGEKPNFEVTLKDGNTLNSEHIILSIGLQGNPRKLGIDGDSESDFVAYTLEDPAAFKDKTIIVVGAGDAAIENALGLASDNAVHIINRRNEFTRAKDGNLNAVLSAINNKSNKFTCHYNTNVKSLTLPAAGTDKGAIVLDTADGDITIECNHIIARLGAIAPRRFVESCGVEFPNDKPDSIPDLDNHYQSNVKGLYIIGALGGYPLIKQAMNQGYDVIEYIQGNEVKPADYPLLEQQFLLLPYAMDAQKILDLYQQRVPMFKRMNALLFRELIIESNIVIALAGENYQEAKEKQILATQQSFNKITKLIKAGDYLFQAGEYSNSFYTIVEGEVIIETTDNKNISLKAGSFFGEWSLLSGRPRQASVIASDDCILIETPRRIMNKLMNSNDVVNSGINQIFVLRALQTAFRPKLPSAELFKISAQVKLHTFNAGETLFKEKQQGASLFLIRSGTISLEKNVGGVQQTTAQLQSGDLVGELALMGNPIREHTAKAAVRTEVIELNNKQFITLVSSNKEHIGVLQNNLSALLKKSNSMASVVEASNTVKFLLQEGMGEATNALVIDETLCIGCDNCEKACAETHNGLSRLNRESGASFAGLHLPISCRHCEQPHCLKDCPADAIHRAGGGEVFIDDSCIGCGNCETNCPYDAIKMSYDAPKKPGLLSWLFFGAGSGPGEPENFTPTTQAKDKGKKAVKCDACMDQSHGPACVRSCPTGAAIRIAPDDFISLLDDS